MKIYIAQTIKSIRAQLGITQEQLAKLINRKDRSCIADYETGRSRISAEDWLKIQELAQNTKGRGR